MEKRLHEGGMENNSMSRYQARALGFASRSRLCLTMRLLSAILILLFTILLPCSVQAQEADAEVLVAEGVFAYDAKRYDEAIALLSRAVALDPRHARAFYYLALCHLARGHAEQAIAPLSTLRTLRPSDPEVAYQLGAVLFALKNYEKAAPLLEEVFRQEPERENWDSMWGFFAMDRKIMTAQPRHSA